jgi:hypothetical protein
MPLLLHGDENKPIEGTLYTGEHTYKLTQAVAYESKSDDGATITVVGSDRKIDLGTIKKALQEGKGSDVQSFLSSQPHVMIRLKPSGKPVRGYGWAESTYFGFLSDDPVSDLKIEGGRIRGHIRVEVEAFKVKRNFDMRLDIAVGIDGNSKAESKSAGTTKPSVTGTFKGNGKAAELAYVSARRGEPFADKPTLVIVFTEKDHSREKRPEVKAGFGDFGSALIITAYDNGKIVGCEVAHTAHMKKPFSSIGNVTTSEFEVDDGRVDGRISSDGEVKTFDQTWEIDIKFTAPFSESPSKAVTKEEGPTKRPRAKPAAETAEPEPIKKAGPALNAKDLPLPKDATNVERRKLVKQIVCQSSSSVETIAGDLTKRLAEQGWSENGSDLVNAKSAILKRTHGDATLTIMVKATDNGSRVTIFTKGLDWE